MMMFLYFTTIFLFILLCITLCFVVLIQEGKGGGGVIGLTAGDTSNSLFGAATSDVLKRFTSWLVFFFLASCVLLSLWTASLARSSQKKNVPLVEEVD